VSLPIVMPALADGFAACRPASSGLTMTKYPIGSPRTRPLAPDVMLDHLGTPTPESASPVIDPILVGGQDTSPDWRRTMECPGQRILRLSPVPTDICAEGLRFRLD
jgi:hypothetical protein